MTNNYIVGMKYRLFKLICDISKAFDRVWHKGLVYKLNQYDVSGKLLEWFKNYLQGRDQRVVVNGQCSDWKKVEAGVPQGSIVGTCIIFIHDIVEDINASILSSLQTTQVSIFKSMIIMLLQRFLKETLTKFTRGQNNRW